MAVLLLMALAGGMAGLPIIARAGAAERAMQPLAPPPSVSDGPAIFKVIGLRGIVYGQGFIFAGSAQQRAVNLTLDAFVPTQLPGGPVVPDSPRPAIVFMHGGAFSGSILDKTLRVKTDVRYFVQRGFVGFQMKYRLREDNAPWPQGWPARGRTGGALLGLQPPIADRGARTWSQRFRFVEGGESGGDGGSMLALASNPELCAVARKQGGFVAMEPCPATAAVPAGDNAPTYRWRVGRHGSFVGVGGKFDQKCLGTKAPRTDKWAFVGKMASRCNRKAPAQRWHADGLRARGGGRICHPSVGKPGPGGDGSRAGVGATPPEDSGCLTFEGGFQPPLSALYPAVRDAKAAVRWLRAEGAARFGVDPRYITLAGASAGACAILGAGICQVDGDYTTEIPTEVDPTIASTHPEVSSAVRSMLLYWGAPFAVDAVTAADPRRRSRYQRAAGHGAADAPLPSIIAYNGLLDTTTPIGHILDVQRAYAAANGTMVVRPLPGQPHACWSAKVVQPQPDGTNRMVSMPADALAFIRSVQELPPIFFW